MTPENLIFKIIELQNDANSHYNTISDILKKADELTEELMEVTGNRFVHHGILYKFQHSAIGYGKPGNRDWLMQDSEIRVFE